jgi:hypothetical protein
MIYSGCNKCSGCQFRPRIYTDSQTHDPLLMLEIPRTQVGGQIDGRARATFTRYE